MLSARILCLLGGLLGATNAFSTVPVDPTPTITSVEEISASMVTGLKESFAAVSSSFGEESVEAVAKEMINSVPELNAYVLKILSHLTGMEAWRTGVPSNGIPRANPAISRMISPIRIICCSRGRASQHSHHLLCSRRRASQRRGQTP